MSNLKSTFRLIAPKTQENSDIIAVVTFTPSLEDGETLKELRTS
jgi:hypothetical protein